MLDTSRSIENIMVEKQKGPSRITKENPRKDRRVVLANDVEKSLLVNFVKRILEIDEPHDKLAVKGLLTNSAIEGVQ